MRLAMAGIVTASVIGAVGMSAPYVSAQGYGVQDRSSETSDHHYGSMNSSMRGRDAILEAQAGALGVTVDELQTALADGKTMEDIKADVGVSTEEYQAAMAANAEARWQDRRLSEEEIAERRARQDARQSECDGTSTHQAEGGYGRQSHS